MLPKQTRSIIHHDDVGTYLEMLKIRKGIQAKKCLG